MTAENSPQPISPPWIAVESDGVSEADLISLLVSDGYHCDSIVGLQAWSASGTAGNIDLLLLTSPNCLAREVRLVREAVDGYLPVLVICDRIDESLMECYEGAAIDAFIVRPVNPRLLLDKIRSSLNNRRIWQYQIAQNGELADFRRMLDAERRLAARIFDSVLKSNCLVSEAVEAELSPSSLFHGDLLLVARTPDQRLHVLLGKFSGQGLAASVAATPTAEIFYGMTGKGFVIADIVREINGKLRKILPNDRFFAATAVALIPELKQLTLIGCGLPGHYWVNNDNGCCKVIRSRNIPLGIQDSIAPEEEHLMVTGRESLYMFTEAIIEAEHADTLDLPELMMRTLRHDGGGGLKALRSLLVRRTGREDVTALKLNCDVDNAPWSDNGAASSMGYGDALRWKAVMEFEADALKTINPVPAMVNTLMDIQGLQSHRQAIFIIVNELFANALDHGLLELDSAIKDSPEGFVSFYQLKEERLSRMRHGRIRFLFVHRPSEQGGRLIIKVSDSGRGFDWQQRRADLKDMLGFCGRGLKLVETLCSSLTYQGRGNRITAVFDWHQ